MLVTSFATIRTEVFRDVDALKKAALARTALD
jgi:hypothetical protein